MRSHAEACNERLVTVNAPSRFQWIRKSVLTVAVATAALPSLAFSNKQAEQAGASLYHDKGCAFCHGDHGQGTGKGPSLAHLRKQWKAPRIAEQIENGGQKMPSFKDSLSTDEVGQLVAWLRSKKGPSASFK